MKFNSKKTRDRDRNKLLAAYIPDKASIKDCGKILIAQ